MTIYNHAKQKVEEEEERKIREEKEAKDLAEKMKPVNITTMRYRTKVGDVENKTMNFTSVDRKTMTNMVEFTKVKQKDSFDYNLLSSKIQPYDTKTFDKKIRFKKNSIDMNSSVKPASMYETKAKIESEELKGFEV